MSPAEDSRRVREARREAAAGKVDCECPHCRTEFTALASSLGKWVRCLRCRKLFKVRRAEP